jgi:hypothetical protein
MAVARGRIHAERSEIQEQSGCFMGLSAPEHCVSPLSPDLEGRPGGLFILQAPGGSPCKQRGVKVARSDARSGLAQKAPPGMEQVAAQKDVGLKAVSDEGKCSIRHCNGFEKVKHPTDALRNGSRHGGSIPTAEEQELQESLGRHPLVEDGLLPVHAVRRNLPQDFALQQPHPLSKSLRGAGEFREEQSQLGKPQGFDEQVIVGRLVFEGSLDPDT